MPTVSEVSSSSTAEHFRLTGPSLALDPRIHAFRRDLSDIALAGKIIAPHYARALRRGCGTRPAAIWANPKTEGDPVTELLPGEDFAVLEYAGGWAWGYRSDDHVVGYVEAIALAETVEASHMVCEKSAPVTADGGVTSPVTAHLPMGSRLHGDAKGACLLTEIGCVPMSHLRPIDEPEADPVIVAERLLGTAYRPGGRSVEGIDGPGLIQLSFGLCGLNMPRLVDQLQTVGEDIAEGERSRRGDLVLCDGDAGLMIDDLLLIHACPKAGKVMVEALAAIESDRIMRRRLEF